MARRFQPTFRDFDLVARAANTGAAIDRDASAREIKVLEGAWVLASRAINTSGFEMRPAERVPPPKSRAA